MRQLTSAEPIVPPIAAATRKSAADEIRNAAQRSPTKTRAVMPDLRVTGFKAVDGVEDQGRLAPTTPRCQSLPVAAKPRIACVD
jgi:hypothetical protein